MSRIVAGVVASAIGLAAYLWSGWRSVGIGAAIGSFALIDRLGWIPDPYEPSVSRMLHGTDEEKPPT